MKPRVLLAGPLAERSPLNELLTEIMNRGIDEWVHLDLAPTSVKTPIPSIAARLLAQQGVAPYDVGIAVGDLDGIAMNANLWRPCKTLIAYVTRETIRPDIERHRLTPAREGIEDLIAWFEGQEMPQNAELIRAHRRAIPVPLTLRERLASFHAIVPVDEATARLVEPHTSVMAEPATPEELAAWLPTVTRTVPEPPDEPMADLDFRGRDGAIPNAVIEDRRRSRALVQLVRADLSEAKRERAALVVAGLR